MHTDLQSNTTATFGLLALLAIVFAFSKLYFVLTSPLANLPGPAISKWTNIQLKMAVLQGLRPRYVHKLHERYGPIVRIAPDEVSVADVSAARAIYKTGSLFVKTKWYAAFAGDTKHHSLFTQIDRKDHSDLRRIVAANFTERWTKNLEPYMARNVQLAVDKMADDVRVNGYTDLFKWFTFMATDVIGEAAFGESFRVTEAGKKTQYVHDVEETGRRGIFRAEFPLLSTLLSKIPAKDSREFAASVKRLAQYAEQSVQRYWSKLQDDPVNVKPTLLTKEYASVETGVLTTAQLQRDAMGYIIAGTDTTAIAATYAVWMLCQHPDIEQDLIREVAGLPSNFNDEDLRNLPVLHGVIQETLRIRGPLNQCLPRAVPQGGAKFGGWYIPAGSVVGVQPYTMHRDPSIWEEPEVFKPSRWDAPTKDMKDSFLSFGAGSRVCIGMHFATIELRHALTNFYKTFDSGVKPSPAEGFSERDMEQMSYFLSPPKGKRCLVMPRKPQQ